MNEPVRLSKLMAERGMCSRRKADELIAKGWVKVNGTVVSELGSKVLRDVAIDLDPRARQSLLAAVTIILNKPVGYVSGQPEDGYEPAVRLVTRENHERGPKDHQLRREHLEGLAPAGRLDIDSQGLLVFTQNGVIARKLIGSERDVEKEYLVRVRGKLTDQGLKQLQHGLMLDGVALLPAKVEWINEDQLRFVLREGRKRQIRRMCELVGLEVTGLKRVRIGKVKLGKLPEGKWRFLGDNEVF